MNITPKKALLQNKLDGYFNEEVEKRLHTDYHEEVLGRVYYAPALELEDRRQQMDCLDKLLKKERERQVLKQEEFQKRWEAASQQFKTTEKSIGLLNTHYMELKASEARYHEFTCRQVELQDLKINDIKALRKEIMVLNDIKYQITRRLERYKVVETYLAKVIESCDGEYKNIIEIVDRANLLLLTRSELSERHERARDQVHRRERQMLTLSMIKSNEMVSLNNNVFELQQYLSNAQSSCMQMENELAHVKGTAAQRTKDLGRVRIAIYNLYLQICKRLHHSSKIPSADTINQLQSIRISMVEVNKLRKTVKYLLKEAHTEAEKEKLAQEKLLTFIAREKRILAAKSRVIKVKDPAEIFGLKPRAETIEEVDQLLLQKMDKMKARAKSRDSGS